MYETLLRLWKEKKLTETSLNNAVVKKWITSEQANIILSTPQE